jgi:hypothetical protein
MELKFIDVEQNSDEWYSLRAGRITGSNFPKIMANYPNAFGEPAKQYAINIAIERITGKPVQTGYKNEHMDRGHEQEPLAIIEYENIHFCDTQPGGFYYNDFIGCSPDFRVYDEGLGEVKSHLPHIHFKNVKRGNIDPQYKWQIWGNLKFINRNWIDYVSFCGNYPPGNQIFTCRIKKEDCSEQFKALDKRIDEFMILVDKCEKEIRG